MEGFILSLDPTRVLRDSKGWTVDRLYMSLGGLYELIEAMALEDVSTTKGAISILHRNLGGQIDTSFPLETQEAGVLRAPKGPKGQELFDEPLHALALFTFPTNDLQVYAFTGDYLLIDDTKEAEVIHLL